MKVICKKNTAKGLDLKKVTTLFMDKYEYGLELEKEYIVMGIVLYRDSNCLYYLVDEDGRPSWYPYMLFEVKDNSLPLHWYLKIVDRELNSDIYTIWGFYELSHDLTYYDRLIDRQEEAMSTYFKRKMDLEKEDEIREWI